MKLEINVTDSNLEPYVIRIILENVTLARVAWAAVENYICIILLASGVYKYAFFVFTRISILYIFFYFCNYSLKITQ